MKHERMKGVLEHIWGVEVRHEALNIYHRGWRPVPSSGYHIGTGLVASLLTISH